MRYQAGEAIKVRRLVLPTKYGRVMFLPEEIISLVEDTRHPGKTTIYTTLWPDGVEVTLAFDDMLALYCSSFDFEEDEEYEYDEDDTLGDEEE